MSNDKTFNTTEYYVWYEFIMMTSSILSELINIYHFSTYRSIDISSHSTKFLPNKIYNWSNQRLFWGKQIRICKFKADKHFLWNNAYWWYTHSKNPMG